MLLKRALHKKCWVKPQEIAKFSKRVFNFGTHQQFFLIQQAVLLWFS